MGVRTSILGLAGFCLLAVSGAAAQASGAWDLEKVQMVSQTRGWALAQTSRGSILLKTSDSGRHWQNISPRGIWPLSPALVQMSQDVGAEGIDACSLDGRTGWVAMENHRDQVVVERTRDGGRHWAMSQFPDRVGYSLILSFRDPEHGSILTISDMASGSTRKALYRTNNGGKTWSVVTEALPDHIDPHGVTFQNGSVGWLSAGYHGSDETPFYRTGDAGRHWRLQELDTSPLRDTSPHRQDGYGETYPPAFFGSGRRSGILPMRYEAHNPKRGGFALYETRNAGGT